MMLNLLVGICVTLILSDKILIGAFNSNALMLGKMRRSLSMEYIPDGLSKEQWAKMKEEEAKKVAGKDLGKVGITKFKSRSFEAWQKDGQRHLFPVDPKTPLEAKPYMQRSGGSWDASDLAGKKVVDQAIGGKYTELDKKYEQLEKEGKLTSAPWAKNLPWTNDAAQKMANNGKTPATSVKKVEAATPVKKEEPPKKKGFFGF